MLPRRLAFLPLIIGALYTTFSSQILIGPFHFSAIRILIGVGFLRVSLRREKVIGNFNVLDKLIIISALWALISSFMYVDFSEALQFRLGFVYNTCGAYFLFRIFCQSIEDLYEIILILAIAVIPVAAEMIYEQIAGKNIFYLLDGLEISAAIREGKIRSQGPFNHAIIAGSVGAVFMPLILASWHKMPKLSALGLIACLIMVVTCGSSGPVISASAGIGAVVIFWFRSKIKVFKYLVIFGYILANIVMNAPAYYLLAKMDIIGGSTGWHRARLIESALEHLNEWWLVGTDYTRHWMPTGVYFSSKHADITNHFLWLGVMAGLPIVLMTLYAFLVAFRFIGKIVMQYEKYNYPKEHIFMIWAVGASLFAHTVTCIGVAYYDQSFIFLYMILAVVGSMHNVIDNYA
jgi:hypothetical protein